MYRRDWIGGHIQENAVKKQPARQHLISKWTHQAECHRLKKQKKEKSAKKSNILQLCLLYVLYSVLTCDWEAACDCGC